MKRILFVDDEPHILDGLRRMLRPMRHEWTMDFQPGGDKALEALDQSPFDVVVCDMKMPGMSGAELLSEVQQRHPGVIRFVLSGHADEENVRSTVGSAHQFLSKPCDRDDLVQTVERATRLRELLDGDALKDLVTGIDDLPKAPTVYRKVMEELSRNNAPLQTIGAIIGEDVGMSAKLLKLVNSSFFGLFKPVHSIERAVVHLGLETVQALVLGEHIFSSGETGDATGKLVDDIRQHSVQVAACARALARDADFSQASTQDAFTAGMLHDSGKLIFLAGLREPYTELLQEQGGVLLTAGLERERLGAAHGEVGAYLLGLWGLPDAIVEAVAYHEGPSESLESAFGVNGAVHVAGVLARRPGAETAEEAAPLVDPEYLERIGGAGLWPHWKEVCAEHLAATEEAN